MEEGTNNRKPERRVWSVDSGSNGYYYWTGIMSLSVAYNLIFIIARAVFWKLQDDHTRYWLCLDYSTDALYLIDTVVNLKTAYYEEGLLIRNGRKMFKKYLKSFKFKIDLISILPTDLMYFVYSDFWVIFRINRLLRTYRIQDFFERNDNLSKFPHFFRVMKLLIFIFMIIHWNACIYFQVSKMIGFGSDEWVYPNISDPINQSLGRMYIYSFYWSTLTLTTIGGTPNPVMDSEYVFITIEYFIGVLVIATIVGSVGNIISDMNSCSTTFQHEMDGVKQYMKYNKVSHALENKVIKWFNYMWQWNRTKSMNEQKMLSCLPNRLRVEIAMNVHLATLRKVPLFQKFEYSLLEELVQKLKLAVFSPGDFICRKGDVGKEMFIVQRGRLQVLSEDSEQVYATLTNGSIFGEVSLIDIPGNSNGNRRTANVRSIGYSDVFILSKQDLYEILKHYSDAEASLIACGRQMLAKYEISNDEWSSYNR